uniref:Inositol 3-kinase n=1 Tax=Oryza meridionalis TaxID=40149 RepID=A0A0E0D6K3_9ORYZ
MAPSPAAAMPLAAEPDDPEVEVEVVVVEERGVKGGGGVAGLDEVEGLVVGSYCHDVLLRGGRAVGETLGGAAAFVSNVLDAASPAGASLAVVSKVGHDFAYATAAAPARHPPVLCASPTTSFHARFSDDAASAHAPDRQLRRVHACDPIYPADLPDRRFAYGLAVGVAGEVLPETLERMIRLCRAVLVDAQALIRAFDGEAKGGGAVRHVALEATPYARLLPRVAFLKASSEEAPYVGVETARRRCCVIVTEGRDGCRLYWDGGEARVAPFPAVQVDPTGAGDSFLAGFASGLLWGLSATDAALLGNFFGAAAVSQVGVPTFDPKMLQAVKQILEKAVKRPCTHINGNTFTFQRSNIHDELHKSLQEAAMLVCEQKQANSPATDNGDICSINELTSLPS